MGDDTTITTDRFFRHFPVESVLQRTESVCSLFHQGKGYLVFADSASAGAIGEAQGQALQQCLSALAQTAPTSVSLWLNSAGAHFTEPLSGLFQLNAFLERLWQFKSQPCVISVFSNGWLYGGMAMSICACADAIILTTSAQLHLFGYRAYQTGLDFQSMQAQTPSPSMTNPLSEPSKADLPPDSVWHNMIAKTNDPLRWPGLTEQNEHPPYPKIERVSDDVWWFRLLEGVGSR